MEVPDRPPRSWGVSQRGVRLPCLWECGDQCRSVSEQNISRGDDFSESGNPVCVRKLKVVDPVYRVSDGGTSVPKVRGCPVGDTRPNFSFDQGRDPTRLVQPMGGDTVGTRTGALGEGREEGSGVTGDQEEGGEEMGRRLSDGTGGGNTRGSLLVWVLEDRPYG